jgi:uncharacterized OB-fold protein
VSDGVADCDSAFFWDGLAAHELRLQRCRACGRHRFPPMPSCPWCGGTGTDIAMSAGAGEIYSWVTVHRAFDERWAEDVPYTVAVIELAERCRVYARVDAAPDEVGAGLAVVPRFVRHRDWTELRFAPADGPR